MESDDCILLEDKDCFIIPPPNQNVKSNKELADVKNKQGGSFFTTGQLQLARNAYSEAIQLDPDCAIYYANRAAANMGLNELVTVADDLDKAICLDPTYMKAYTRKFNYLFSVGELDKAELVLRQIKSFDQKDNKQINDMEQKLQSVRYSDRNYSQAIEKKDYRTALFYIETIIKSCPSAKVFKLKRAEALAHLFRHEDVIGIVDSIIRQDGFNSDAYFIRGLSYFYQDFLDKALAHFDQALRCEPEHKKCHEYRKKVKSIKSFKDQGKDSVTNGKLDEAIEFYKKALKVDPDSKLGNAKLYFNLSVVYGRQKKPKEALAQINQAIKLDENYDKAYMKRASLYDELEMYEESVKDYEMLYKKLKTKETKEYLDKAKVQLLRSKRKNYYKILGVSKTANDNEIKKAYRKRALEHHPDRHASSSDEEKADQEKRFKDVNEAYNCLIDPHKRQRYDNGYDDVNQQSTSFNNDAFKMFCDEDIINNIFFNLSSKR